MPEEKEKQKKLPRIRKKFKPTKRFVVGSVVLAVVVIAIIVAAYLFSDWERRPDYALYVKNGALYYTDFEDSTFRITSNLTAKDSMLPDVDYDLRYCATLSDDGDYLFFPENMTISGQDVHSFDLCYQRITDSDRKTIRIAQKVTAYHIRSDAMTVTYLTTDGLYQYDLKPAASTLLCKNVIEFQASDRNGRLIFRTAENELYTQAPGFSKVKIDNRVDEILHVSDDYKSVIYRQEHSVHRWIADKGETEICADAVSWSITSSGEAIFLSNEEGYYSLCYYDGESSTLVQEHVSELIMTASDSPVALLTAQQLEEAEGEEKAIAQTQTLLVQETDIYTLEDMNNKLCVGIDGEGENFYFVDRDVTYSTLYQLSFGTFGLSELQIYDTDVYTKNITVTENNWVIYFKDVDEDAGCGTLFLNTSELNAAVSLETNSAQPYSELPDSKQIYYFTDFDADKNQGTLHVASTDGTNRQISGAATDPFMLPNGQILFMEHSTTGNALYVYIKGSTILIDSGVTFYIPVL